MVREKQGQKQTDRGAFQKEAAVLTSCWGDVDAYGAQTTEKPVLAGVPGATRHLPRRLSTTPSPKSELEASGAGDSVLDVKGAVQASDRKSKGEGCPWCVTAGSQNYQVAAIPGSTGIGLRLPCVLVTRVYSYSSYSSV